MTPRLSVIIVAYDMPRELPRTVESFLPPYQRGVADGDVEILVMENGSSRPVPDEARRKWPASVRYVEVADPSPSPARALNAGARMARAELLCPVIDGARMASPGLVAGALEIMRRWPTAFVATLGTHLGPKPQQQSSAEGYNQDAEDRLLAGIRWPSDGYRLFDIAAATSSAPRGWFGTVAESNAPVLSAMLWRDLQGYDEAFDIPGGGIVNHDFLHRAVERPDIDYFMLLGEATFHQFHGGVTTSRSVAQIEADGRSTWDRYADQYAKIRGKPYALPARRPRFHGELVPQAMQFAAASLGGEAR